MPLLELISILVSFLIVAGVIAYQQVGGISWGPRRNRFTAERPDKEEAEDPTSTGSGTGDKGAPE